VASSILSGLKEESPIENFGIPYFKILIIYLEDNRSTVFETPN
jgi:hypothetical protein